METGKRLLIVEDRFQIEGRGLLIVPPVELGPLAGYTLEVELRRPDGTTRRAIARGWKEHFRPPVPSTKRGHVLQFADLTKEDIPIGTEVWDVE